MNAFMPHNAPDLAAISPSNLPPETECNESEYLAREIADAKAALIHAAADLKDGLSKSADLRPWIQHYPWIALGVATVAGFTAATAITPASAPKDSIGDRLSHLQPNGYGSAHHPISPTPPSPPPVRAGVTSSLLGSLFDVAKVFVESLIIGALRTWTTNQTEPHVTVGDSSSSSVTDL
jgi:hypothetical protein